MIPALVSVALGLFAGWAVTNILGSYRYGHLRGLSNGELRVHRDRAIFASALRSPIYINAVLDEVKRRRADGTWSEVSP